MSKQVSRRVGGDFLSSPSKNHTEGQADRKAAVPVLEKTAGQTEPKGEENNLFFMYPVWFITVLLLLIGGLKRLL